MKTIKDFNFENQVVIIRSDFNVPMENGVITDDTRIKAALDTIRYIVNQGAKVVVLSHMGRIKSEEDKQKYSLRKAAERLNDLIYEEVTFIPYTKGPVVENAIANMEPGSLIVLENTRFEDYPEKKESSNDEELGKYWASLGNIFINDAFATAHRAHASNVGIATYLPSGIGFLMEKELKAFELITNNPKKDYMVVMGGAKISDKIPLIESLIEKADKLLIGGGMCFTFFKALGYNTGRSIIDQESLDFCARILREYPEKIVLPIDIVVGNEFSVNAVPRVKKASQISNAEMGLDIGPETIAMFDEVLRKAKTVFWNGPMGVFEFPRFNKGTIKIGEVLGKIRANVIVGGGDTVAAINTLKIPQKFHHISTGGGASLELLEGKTLPACEVLK